MHSCLALVLTLIVVQVSTLQSQDEGYHEMKRRDFGISSAIIAAATAALGTGGYIRSAVQILLADYRPKVAQK